MQCENCREREAVIHLTQIVNNSVTTMHLCEPCAAEKGVETTSSVAKFPLGDFLASLGKGGSSEPAGEAGLDIPCPSCGATLRDFRQSGRLGCAQCYVVFEAHLRDLLRRLHGSTRHEGEPYKTGTSPAGRPLVPALASIRTKEDALDELKDALRRAIELENFELAAELRDKIRVME
jgi:protein arginine kinase activator